MSSLISKIKRNPIAFSVTPVGRLLTTLFRSVPSAYSTDQYKLPRQKNKPIKIVFSGMGDSGLISYAKDKFTGAYSGQPVYVFGHGQLQQALDFANKIPRTQPVQVFGYSWGSPTAMKFIDRYNGTINKAHYIDPMRHAVVDDAVISNRKNIPTTYMTAGKYGGVRKLHDTLLAALRMKPSKDMILLPQAKNHMALQEALSYIKDNDMKKLASYKEVYQLVKRANLQKKALMPFSKFITTNKVVPDFIRRVWSLSGTPQNKAGRLAGMLSVFRPGQTNSSMVKLFQTISKNGDIPNKYKASALPLFGSLGQLRHVGDVRESAIDPLQRRINSVWTALYNDKNTRQLNKYQQFINSIIRNKRDQLKSVGMPTQPKNGFYDLIDSIGRYIDFPWRKR